MGSKKASHKPKFHQKVKGDEKPRIQNQKPPKKKAATVSLKSPDFSILPKFERSFWSGPPGEQEPSAELKSVRKGLGVLVRGQLTMCPPPIVGINDDSLPTHFKQVFDALELKVPSPIQQQCWPCILAGANVLAIAPTGSGKTLGYVCPMIIHILQAKSVKIGRVGSGPIGLVLVPTRELAIQVQQNFKVCKRLFELRSCAIYGGQDKDIQMQALTSDGGSHIVVATPGRLLDLLQTKNISLLRVTYLVLDEADRMLALGFDEQLNAIISQIRPDRQAVLFTATFPGKLREAADKWIGDAVTIRCSTMEIANAEPQVEATTKKQLQDRSSVAEIVKQSGTNSQSPQANAIQDDQASMVEGDSSGAPQPAGNSMEKDIQALTSSVTISRAISQMVHVCASHKKPRLLMKFILLTRNAEKETKVRQPGLMLIFCTKIKTVKFVFDFLKRHDQAVGADILHGSLPQSQREKILVNFKAGKLHTLVATDVAARGIHVKRLRYVVNYDFPTNLEQYCHRIGRTGRQGEQGVAYSLISRNMGPLAPGLMTLLQSCGQRVEPNLSQLAEEYAGRRAGQTSESGEAATENDGDEEGEEEGGDSPDEFDDNDSDTS